MRTKQERLDFLQQNQRQVELMARLLIFASCMGAQFQPEDIEVLGLWLMQHIQANKRAFGKEGGDEQ